MVISGAEHAIISREKTVPYLLNLDRPESGSKATVLALAGFSRERAEKLEHALRNKRLSMDARRGKPSPYGEKYEIVGPRGRVMVRSVWMVRYGESAPRLSTLIPKKLE
jgi:hypothetical protein